VATITAWKPPMSSEHSVSCMQTPVSLAHSHVARRAGAAGRGECGCRDRWRRGACRRRSAPGERVRLPRLRTSSSAARFTGLDHGNHPFNARAYHRQRPVCGRTRGKLAAHNWGAASVTMLFELGDKGSVRSEQPINSRQVRVSAHVGSSCPFLPDEARRRRRASDGTT